MRMVFLGVRTVVRATRGIASFGVNVVIPWFGITRPWNYLAAGFWLFWIAIICYAIATK